MTSSKKVIAEPKKFRYCADRAHGRILDVGYAFCPNPFLRNAVGLDRRPNGRPPNYRSVVLFDLNDATLPFRPASFDSVIASDVLEHLDNPPQFLRECHRVLRPRGTLVITAFNAFYVWHLAENVIGTMAETEHMTIWTPELLKHDVRYTGFRIDDLQGLGFEIPHWRTFDWWMPTLLGKKILCTATKTRGRSSA